MSNPSKKRGTAWESKIVAWLREEGMRPFRQPLTGAKDCGDIHLGCDLVIEAKNQNRHSFAEWLDEANAEAHNASAAIGVVWAHRKGKGSPADGYVVMDGRSFAYLLREAGMAEGAD